MISLPWFLSYLFWAIKALELLDKYAPPLSVMQGLFHLSLHLLQIEVDPLAVSKPLATLVFLSSSHCCVSFHLYVSPDYSLSGWSSEGFFFFFEGGHAGSLNSQPMITSL